MPEESVINDEEENMKLYFNDIEIPVIWEDNQTVQELMKEAGNGDIIVQMSMYSDNEQVGSLGKKYTRDDKQTTTHNGDIVLYSGDKIVVFYGSNSWAYTRLGKMNIPESDVKELLSNGDITLKMTIVKQKIKLLFFVKQPSHIESVCVLEKKQFNVKPTRKAQRQAQFRLSKMSKKKRWSCNE